MWQEVAKLDDIVPGGMKYVRPNDREICLAAATTTSTP